MLEPGRPISERVEYQAVVDSIDDYLHLLMLKSKQGDLSQYETDRLEDFLLRWCLEFGKEFNKNFSR